MKKYINLTLAGCGLLGFLLITGLVRGEDEKHEKHEMSVKKAICVVHALGDSGVAGIVTFTQRDGFVEVYAQITGLTAGSHGFHIHEFGDLSAADGSSAGGHFNPGHAPHGGPEAKEHHAGDLGNLEADEDHVAHFELNDKTIKLNGPNSIVGRSIIIHAKADDLKTQPSGDSGPRIAGGTIGIGKPE